MLEGTLVHLALQVTGVLQDILVRLDLEDHKAQKVIEVIKVTRDKPVHQVCSKTVSLLLIAHHNTYIFIAIDLIVIQLLLYIILKCLLDCRSIWAQGN